ncbi:MULTISPECIES: glycosyltransferase [Bosea]|uniref:glycosyltransferase n=1 Tax=Bosea TaxID=85413 RepID=UPI00214F6D69|nr:MULTISPECIES: glycosyltransferase [Bosea]MCR4523807.1 glycosyltransferase [Bosea sp. 47.2.35]MDR6830375.1 glycosyltransferase involved in cell wall biosynthesis [Bosea robiniae]MDR6897130.1 glycosyltransferase involved in cell wall biosynthesis [Bosea sp. BE109]MDR7140527.1 glycosyltransferase involved in cell wall biosynthesis [Bosea sp. BE168]MDR7177152.1 glycosyltransferase involved in cell wall biosynthesis [Bosea sp. BE271]
MKIALVCIGPLRHDSRVLRHAELLSQAGHAVRIFAQAPLPETPVNDVAPLPGPGSNLRIRLGLVGRHAPASLWPASASLLYWASLTRLAARRQLLDYRPDLVIANDWRALPLASAAKRACNARIIYDSHEFATEEFADSKPWRLLAQQHVAWIENRFIREADAVIAVSSGLSEALAERYALPVKPDVIANMPRKQPGVFRQTGSTTHVLYHGVVAPRRGLETLIDSVHAWPAQYRLTIRGESAGDFREALVNRAAALGDRVRFEPAVPPHRVVEAARDADIGIFLLSNSTIHARFALPNKLFEYLAAGLMVVSSDLPEIRKIIEGTACGALLVAFSADAIAELLNTLTPEQIDQCKRNSLRAAEAFNFETEGKRLLDIVERTGRKAPL